MATAGELRLEAHRVVLHGLPAGRQLDADVARCRVRGTYSPDLAMLEQSLRRHPSGYAALVLLTGVAIYAVSGSGVALAMGVTGAVSRFAYWTQQNRKARQEMEAGPH
jgi:hypothetical protein